MNHPPRFAGAEVNPAPFGYFPGTRIPRKSPPADHHEGRGVCKFCGAGDLTWEKQGDRWRLCDMGGKTHVCPVKNNTAPADGPAPAINGNTVKSDGVNTP
jgi:hypothetical protein